jgi:cytochrome b561
MNKLKKILLVVLAGLGVVFHWILGLLLAFLVLMFLFGLAQATVEWIRDSPTPARRKARVSFLLLVAGIISLPSGVVGWALLAASLFLAVLAFLQMCITGIKNLFTGNKQLPERGYDGSSWQ